MRTLTAASGAREADIRAATSKAFGVELGAEVGRGRWGVVLEAGSRVVKLTADTSEFALATEQRQRKSPTLPAVYGIVTIEGRKGKITAILLERVGGRAANENEVRSVQRAWAVSFGSVGEEALERVETLCSEQSASFFKGLSPLLEASGTTPDLIASNLKVVGDRIVLVDLGAGERFEEDLPAASVTLERALSSSEGLAALRCLARGKEVVQEGESFRLETKRSR